MNSKFFAKARVSIVSVFILVLTLSIIAGGCTSSTKLGGKKIAEEPTSTLSGTGTQQPNQTAQQQSSADTAQAQTNGSTETEAGENDGNIGGSEVRLENQTPRSKDIKVKALYLTGWTVGSMTKVKHYVELANTTEINSYVIDIKDDDGLVGYESQIPAVREIGGWKKKYDVDKVLKEFHDNNIHIIGRIVCFKDPVLSSKKPDLAVKNKDGEIWKDNQKISWLNPYNQDSWPYIIDIAKEAVNKGFDEIQFDYVRFPNDGKGMDFGNSDKSRSDAINEFLAYARKELPNVVLSADVFGIICEGPGDTGDSKTLGQWLEKIGKDIDYVSPMAYPSHYALGQIVNQVKFLKPDLDPYGVVYNTLLKAKNRIANVEGYKAKLRPYLQDFTATWLGKGNYQQYGPEQMRQQIKAVTDAGLDEWIFWDAGNTYSEAGLAKEN